MNKHIFPVKCTRKGEGARRYKVIQGHEEISNFLTKRVGEKSHNLVRNNNK